jgi:hypothetical protein
MRPDIFAPARPGVNKELKQLEVHHGDQPAAGKSMTVSIHHPDGLSLFAIFILIRGSR